MYLGHIKKKLSKQSLGTSFGEEKEIWKIIKYYFGVRKEKEKKFTNINLLSRIIVSIII